jgi:NDP-sugar pyrophosphorylase family protein
MDKKQMTIKEYVDKYGEKIDRTYKQVSKALYYVKHDAPYCEPVTYAKDNAGNFVDVYRELDIVRSITRYNFGHTNQWVATVLLNMRQHADTKHNIEVWLGDYTANENIRDLVQLRRKNLMCNWFMADMTTHDPDTLLNNGIIVYKCNSLTAAGRYLEKMSFSLRILGDVYFVDGDNIDENCHITGDLDRIIAEDFIGKRKVKF